MVAISFGVDARVKVFKVRKTASVGAWVILRASAAAFVANLVVFTACASNLAAIAASLAASEAAFEVAA